MADGRNSSYFQLQISPPKCPHRTGQFWDRVYCASGHCMEGGGGGDTAGGAEGDGDGLKGSDHKEQEQSVFVAVCAASITSHHQPSPAITATLISNGKTWRRR